MTTLRHEWRWHSRLLRGWLIAILITLALFLSFYPAFLSASDELIDMLEAFPKEVLLGFGLDVTTFGSYSGYLAYIYTFVQLLLGILSVMSGLYLLGREKLNKTGDFLFSKPISRRALWLQKIMVGLGGILLINLLIAAVIYSVGIVLKIEWDQSILPILIGSSLIQVMFFFLGAAIASWRKRLRTVTGQATSISFGFYFLLVIARLLEEDKLAKLSLYGLFDTAEVQRNGIDQTNLLIGLGLIVILAGLSFWRYTQMDLEV